MLRARLSDVFLGAVENFFYLTISSVKTAENDEQAIGRKEKILKMSDEYETFMKEGKIAEAFKVSQFHRVTCIYDSLIGLKMKLIINKYCSERVQLHHEIVKVNSRLGPPLKSRRKRDKRSAKNRRNAQICAFHEGYLQSVAV